jgi:Flp pilus assembly pilin Flp
MKTNFHQIWQEDHGVLTFEWVLLLTLLAIGIVSGLTAARDAIIDELGDVANAAVSLDQSFTLAPDPCFNKGGMGFTDSKPTVTSCARGSLTVQGVIPNCSVPSAGS